MLAPNRKHLPVSARDGHISVEVAPFETGHRPPACAADGIGSAKIEPNVNVGPFIGIIMHQKRHAFRSCRCAFIGQSEMVEAQARCREAHRCV